MIINHNIAALRAFRYGKQISAQQMKVMTQLSSGLRINSAADDAAGLAISERMRAQIRGLNQASRNAQDGISLIQTAEGATNEVHSILNRIRELAVQSANGTYTDEERNNMQFEVDELLKEIGNISKNTEFNKMSLLDGTTNNNGTDNNSRITLQVGANKGQIMELEIGSMTTNALGINGLSIATAGDAQNAIDVIDEAVNRTSKTRSKLGAYQNRLEHTINNLENQAENLTAAESRIRDVDMAKAMMEYARLEILSQANTFIQMQSIKQGERVLALLKSLERS
ncbi:flagellin N-terminal helical domain-containing protein [Cellulosilyticum lentocellum]|uniref:Flagellin n=1 Tax=Cellulosilyticum lentocellum (strain ATCC 49066 / DSM 5427 / NCIMB 11756 / RHM5) TaxID=642492 RepID=F2JQ33_CELLD|nr:flagellin [Cellulosilyticum lentocellum]ADZ82581.1 flagellin domain protein [Cellulosilyticum lentocellum DSM 5427]